MQAREDLILYKYHRGNCAVHLQKISADRKRFWMNCACPIWIVGRTPNGDLVPRQSTGCNDMPGAEAIRASLLKRAIDTTKHGPTIAECAQKYMAGRKSELGFKTEDQYRLMLERLVDFCERRGVIYMRGLTVDLLEDFKVEGLSKMKKDTSKATGVAKIRKFLKDALRREWINDPLADKLAPHAAVFEQKVPYTDEEVEKILVEAEKLVGKTHGYASQPKTFRLMLELMLETGLRVGDAVQFDPKRLHCGEHLWIYTFHQQKRKKTARPKPVEVYISERLKAAIDRCSWLSADRPFAWGSFSVPYLAREVYMRMQSIGERCGVEDCRPHRLRDTFAVKALLRGVQLEDVSRLLGHASITVTEMYYAAWVGARKRRLERIVADSLLVAEPLVNA